MIFMTLAMLAQPVVGATPHDVTVPNAIVGLHNEYARCQDQNFDPQRVRSRETFVAEVERQIAACASQKAVLKQRAEAVLAGNSEYRDPAVRAHAIAEAFDGLDRSRRLMARAPSR